MLPLLIGAALSLCCATGGGALSFDHCQIKVLGVDSWRVEPGELDVGYLVAGKAGSAAKTWLVAVDHTGQYISGIGVNVGPGLFKAVIDLKLTGVPKEFIAMLEVSGKRCRAKAKIPAS